MGRLNGKASNQVCIGYQIVIEANTNAIKIGCKYSLDNRLIMLEIVAPRSFLIPIFFSFL